MIEHYSSIIGHHNEKAKWQLCIQVFFIPQLAASADSCELKDEKAKVQLVHPGPTPCFFPASWYCFLAGGSSSWQAKVSLVGWGSFWLARVTSWLLEAWDLRCQALGVGCREARKHNVHPVFHPMSPSLLAGLGFWLVTISSWQTKFLFWLGGFFSWPTGISSRLGKLSSGNNMVRCRKVRMHNTHFRTSPDTNKKIAPAPEKTRRQNHT